MTAPFTPLSNYPSEFYHSVLDEIPAPLVLFDRQRRYIYCNKNAIRNPEIREWIIGHNDDEYCAYRGFDPAMAQRRKKSFDDAERTGQTSTYEEVFHTPQGDIKQLRYITPLFTETGELRYFLGYGLDVTPLRQAEEKLQKLNQELENRVRARTADLENASRQLQYEAMHDALTGLPNRVMFVRRLTSALAEIQHKPAPAKNETGTVLFFLDTDHFKSVNDALGHPAGDRLLIMLAGRMGQILPTNGLLARLGGDEFGVLLSNISKQEALKVAGQFLNLFSKPLHIYGHELLISGSLGVVFIGPEYREATEVLRDADIALYRAKAAGRGGYQVFSLEMREEVLTLINTEKDLRRAIKQNELRPVYQPIMNLRTGKLRGFEALLRWQHPTRGLLTPYHFIEVAENSGLIVELDRWVLRTAVQQLTDWTAGMFPASPLSLSVNVSGRHFARRNIVPELQQLTQEFQLRPGQLHLELTESVLMDNSQNIGEILQQIRNLGIDLHIDDFGTGYSSLSYLHSYPLSTLKIDRSFVQNMSQESRSTELVRTIIAMAKNLRMTVTAEGIENAEQLEILRLMHCDYGQGYYFAKPLEPEAAHAFWLEHR